jgi:excinuclease ABC subunit C
MTNNKLKGIAKKAPDLPGVYIWKNTKKEIIYVGRASNLKNRLAQYFLSDANSKTKEIVKQASDLNYIPSQSILESIILEANEIKKHWPIYNVKDRDDRSFIYVTISKEDYPRIKLIRANKLKYFDKINYHIFGPYQSYNLIAKALKLIRRIFPYSNCQAGSAKACFDYQINLCPGICIGKISAANYRKNINNIILILEGKKESLIKKLQVKNPSLALSLKHLQDVSLLQAEVDLKQKFNQRIEAYDISHWQGKESVGSMVVWQNNYFQTSEYRLFKIKEAPANDDLRALEEVLTRRLKHKNWPKAQLILIDGGRPQVQYLEIKFKSLALVGLSKLEGDHLVFSKAIKNREELKKLFIIFQKLRDEAHRFANYGRKRVKK